MRRLLHLWIVLPNSQTPPRWVGGEQPSLGSMANNFDRDLDGFFFYPYNFSFPYKILEFPAGNREKSGKGKTAKSKEGKAVRI